MGLFGSSKTYFRTISMPHQQRTKGKSELKARWLTKLIEKYMYRNFLSKMWKGNNVHDLHSAMLLKFAGLTFNFFYFALHLEQS